MAGAHAAAGLLAVALVEPVHDIHAFDNPAEWREAVAILALHAVIRADVDLRSARAGAGHGEGERAAHIAGALFVVWKLRLAPDLRQGGVAGDSKLREAARHDAEEARVVVKARLHQVVEAVGAAWCERARHFHDEGALGGFHAHAVEIRRRPAP